MDKLKLFTDLFLTLLLPSRALSFFSGRPCQGTCLRWHLSTLTSSLPNTQDTTRAHTHTFTHTRTLIALPPSLLRTEFGCLGRTEAFDDRGGWTGGRCLVSSRGDPEGRRFCGRVALSYFRHRGRKVGARGGPDEGGERTRISTPIRCNDRLIDRLAARRTRNQVRCCKQVRVAGLVGKAADYRGAVV